jgi:hypothetical protein
MPNHLYAQPADDGQTIANVCVVADVGSVTEFTAGTRVLFGIAEAEALGWAWLGPEDSPNVDPDTGLVPGVGWTVALASPAVTQKQNQIGGAVVGTAGSLLPPAAAVQAGLSVVAAVAPTPAVWSFTPPPTLTSRSLPLAR